MTVVEREYTDYEKRILQHNEDLCAAIKTSVETDNEENRARVIDVLDAWRAEWKDRPPEGGVAP